MTRLAAVCLALLIAASGACFAKGGGHGGGAHSSHKAQGVARESHGKIARSAQARHSFKKAHPCPATGRISGACPGYVIDHIHPLKRGGADAPGNMQWQTTAEARAKDRWE